MDKNINSEDTLKKENKNTQTKKKTAKKDTKTAKKDTKAAKKDTKAAKKDAKAAKKDAKIKAEKDTKTVENESSNTTIQRIDKLYLFSLWSFFIISIFILLAISSFPNIQVNDKILPVIIFSVIIVWIILFIIKMEKLNYKDKRNLSIISIIMSGFLLIMSFLFFLQQDKFIQKIFWVVWKLTVINNTLNQQITNKQIQLWKIEKNYNAKIQELNKEKLEYWNKVKNETIDVIINNLKRFKQQKIK